MRRLVTVGAAALLAAGGCVMAGFTDKSTSATGTKPAAAEQWPSRLPGRTHIAQGVYSVDALGMENVLWYENYYYKLTFSIWYRSAMPRSGWMVTANVPQAFKSIPPGHPKYHMVKEVP